MTLVIELKEEFMEAARRQDFSGPVLADMKALLDRHGVTLVPLNDAPGSPVLAEIFLVNGDGSNDPALVEALKKSPAVSRVPKRSIKCRP